MPTLQIAGPAIIPAPARGLQSRGRAFDLAEQVTTTILYALLVTRLWPSDFSDWPVLILLLSEGLILLLLIIRRHTENISIRARDWTIAFAGTFLPLLVAPGGEPLSGAVGGAFLLTGLCVHLGAKLSLGRSFGLVAAHRGIQVQGLYRFLRHPMYAGYFLAHAGYLVAAPTLWNLAVYSGAWILLTARVFAEERVLGTDPGYRAYKARVRYRVLPWVF